MNIAEDEARGWQSESLKIDMDRLLSPNIRNAFNDDFIKIASKIVPEYATNRYFKPLPKKIYDKIFKEGRRLEITLLKLTEELISYGINFDPDLFVLSFIIGYMLDVSTFSFGDDHTFVYRVQNASQLKYDIHRTVFRNSDEDKVDDSGPYYPFERSSIGYNKSINTFGQLLPLPRNEDYIKALEYFIDRPDWYINGLKNLLVGVGDTQYKRNYRRMTDAIQYMFNAFFEEDERRSMLKNIRYTESRSPYNNRVDMYPSRDIVTMSVLSENIIAEMKNRKYGNRWRDRNIMSNRNREDRSQSRHRDNSPSIDEWNDTEE